MTSALPIFDELAAEPGYEYTRALFAPAADPAAPAKLAAAKRAAPPPPAGGRGQPHEARAQPRRPAVKATRPRGPDGRFLPRTT